MRQKNLSLIFALLLLSIMGCGVQAPIEGNSAVSETEPPIVSPLPTAIISSAPTPIVTAVSTETPKPSETPGTKLIIHPEIGKHNEQITFTVTVQNTPIPDDYVIKRISEKPVVETEGRVSEQAVQRFWELYELLPDSLRVDFEADEFKVLITKKDLTEYYGGNRNTNGLTIS